MSLASVEAQVVDETGLRKISVDDLTIRRVKHGRGTRVVAPKPTKSADAERIAALAIPPAWTRVRISADPLSHIQAVGRDAAGRLQYIYHADWENVRSAVKTERLANLLASLPRLRRAIHRQLDPDLPKCALAAAARLVDQLSLRAGHEAYASEESGRGVATLLKRHVKVDGDVLSIRYPGKGGKQVCKEFPDAATAAVIARLKERRGERLFKLPSPTGGLRPMTAADLNAYLAEASGKPLTAKDFRTLHASALALDKLTVGPLPRSQSARRRAIAAVAKEVSEGLCNTPAIVRKSYILPSILDRYEAGKLKQPSSSRVPRGLKKAEAALLAFLKSL